LTKRISALNKLCNWVTIKTMKIILNGEVYDSVSGGNLLKLIEETGAVSTQVAVLVNDDVVPKDKRSSFVVKAGDRVELLSFAGGG
jgi:thiamine biosynthesis protein ThiS